MKMKTIVQKPSMIKNESKGSLFSWSPRFLRYCCWSFARGYISTIFVYNLRRLRTLNVDRSNKRKWLYTKNASSRQYSVKTITDSAYADDIARLANTPAQAKSLLHCLEQTTWGICFHVNANKTCFKRRGALSTLKGRPLKLVDKFTYYSSNISYMESELLSIIWMSDLSANIKQDFFQAVAVSILLYRCTM